MKGHQKKMDEFEERLEKVRRRGALVNKIREQKRKNQTIREEI